MNNSQYTKLYGNLVGIPALGVFYHHDLNKVNRQFYYIFRYISYTADQDGYIGFEEMKMRNITIEDFNTLDMDQDGFIIPAELDDSLG